MVHCPFLRVPGTAGSRFASVFQRRQRLGDLSEAVLLGTDIVVLFTSEVADGIFTVYEALVEDLEPVLLGLDSQSIVPFGPVISKFIMILTCKFMISSGKLPLTSQHFSGHADAEAWPTGPAACRRRS